MQMLTHNTASATSPHQSRLSLERQQFNQSIPVSFVSSSSSKPTMAVSNENIDSQLSTPVTSALQQTSTADTSFTVTQILSTGQKKRVDVVFVSCFLCVKCLVEIVSVIFIITLTLIYIFLFFFCWIRFLTDKFISEWQRYLHILTYTCCCVNALLLGCVIN